jgi:DNA-binding transcriptional LysR family regulator
VGVAFVPLSAVGANHSVALIPISRPRLQRHLFLIWQQPTLSPAARAWLDQARSEFTRPTLIADRPSS